MGKRGGGGSKNTKKKSNLRRVGETGSPQMGKKGGGSCGGALKGKLVLEARYREGRHLRTDGNMGTQSRWKRRRQQFKGGGGGLKKSVGGEGKMQAWV